MFRTRLAQRLMVLLTGPFALFLALATPVSWGDEVDKRGSVHVREVAEYLRQVQVYEPIVYRQLAVFPLRLRDADRLRGRWLTMDQANARRLLIIREKSGGGRVPTVIVENRSRDERIFLMSGELLAGGKQSRTIRQDVVLEPGQRVDLSVFCVEAHRWQGGGKLKSGGTLLPQSIQRELRMGADQSRIWKEVARNNRALGAANKTDSLELALNSRAVRDRLQVVRRQILPEIPSDTVGFIFVNGDRAVGCDFFGREDLARGLLPKLLDAYSVDCVLLRKDAGNVRRRDIETIALDFFEEIGRAGSQRSATPGSGAGIRTRSRQLLGDGVSLGGAIVHFGVQTQRRLIPRPKD